MAWTDGNDFTFTYLLCAIWHIRPQDYPANQFCQWLRLVPNSSFPTSFFPFSLCRLFHVPLGLPLFHHPSGVQVNAVLQSLFVFFPYNFKKKSHKKLTIFSSLRLVSWIWSWLDILWGITWMYAHLGVPRAFCVRANLKDTYLVKYFLQFLPKRAKFPWHCPL